MTYRRKMINEITRRAAGCISPSDLEGKYSPVYEGEREAVRPPRWEEWTRQDESCWKTYREQQYR